MNTNYQTFVESVTELITDTSIREHFYNQVLAENILPSESYQLACEILTNQINKELKEMGFSYQIEPELFDVENINDLAEIPYLMGIQINGVEVQLQSSENDKSGIKSLYNYLAEIAFNQSQFLYTIPANVYHVNDANLLEDVMKESIKNSIIFLSQTDKQYKRYHAQELNNVLQDTNFLIEIQDNKIAFVYSQYKHDDSVIIRKFSKDYDLSEYFKNNGIQADIKHQPIEAVFNIEDDVSEIRVSMINRMPIYDANMQRIEPNYHNISLSR